MTVTLTFFRSSITRLSVDDKALRTKEVSSQERDLLLHKSVIPETIPEKKDLPSKSFIITTPTEGAHPFPSCRCCSPAVEHSPRYHEVEGSNPAGLWAIFFDLFFANFASQ